MSAPYKPTPDEIEALVAEMRSEALIFSASSSYIADARWILQRFVSRAEHERVMARAAKDNAELSDALARERR